MLNAGSSSLKASLIEAPDRTLGEAEAALGSDAGRAGSREEALRRILDELGAPSVAGAGDALVAAAVAHRVVHGGDRFGGATLVDDEVVAGIEAVRSLAPLHNAVALEAMTAARSLLPDVPHVACFDTAFHRTLPEEQWRYPVPPRWHVEWGIRRYGFHGLSVEWATGRAAQLLGRRRDGLRLVVAHLGSGCSVTAVEDGRSAATSMGYTPLEGLMMGTRSGSVDPGALIHVLRHGLTDVDALADELDHASGLLGVSGVSGDMRLVTRAAAGGDERAELAAQMFVARAAAAIAGAATALSGLDAVIFTGGIGEHAAGVRTAICERLRVVGVGPLLRDVGGADGRLDDGRGAPAVLRIHAREDLVMARQALELLVPRAD